jgi:L-ribulose-5-phosphate 4-epimerase
VSRYNAIREECCAANAALPAAGLVDLTFGNVSVCDREAGVFAIKPSGIRYDKLTPAEMVIVDMDGKIVEGTLRPSSDTPTHRRLFLAFAHTRAVVHTHSRHAVSFAQAGREIPLLGTTHADYFRGPVPVTRALTASEIASDYEWETGNVIVERFASLDPSEVQAVLVRNHGPFTWGSSGGKAVENAVALEIVAQMALHALQLDPSAPSPATELIDKHFLRKHGPSAYYGQAASK